MKCLIVKPNFAQWIVQGVKRREFRKQYTYNRGRIGIMEPGGWHSPGGMMRRIIGDVDLYDCVLCRDGREAGLYAWLLCNPRMYKDPVFVPIQHGPQVWINAEYDIPTEFAIIKLTGEERMCAELDCIREEFRFFAKWKESK